MSSAPTITSLTLSSETRWALAPPLSLSLSLSRLTTVCVGWVGQMLIELSGQVVVFDEAHNMEDAAREAASLSLSSSQLEELVKELTEICECV